MINLLRNYLVFTLQMRHLPGAMKWPAQSHKANIFNGTLMETSQTRRIFFIPDCNQKVLSAENSGESFHFSIRQFYNYWSKNWRKTLQRDYFVSQGLSCRSVSSFLKEMHRSRRKHSDLTMTLASSQVKPIIMAIQRVMNSSSVGQAGLRLFLAREPGWVVWPPRITFTAFILVYWIFIDIFFKDLL